MAQRPTSMANFQKRRTTQNCTDLQEKNNQLKSWCTLIIHNFSRSWQIFKFLSGQEQLVSFIYDCHEILYYIICYFDKIYRAHGDPLSCTPPKTFYFFINFCFEKFYPMQLFQLRSILWLKKFNLSLGMRGRPKQFFLMEHRTYLYIFIYFIYFTKKGNSTGHNRPNYCIFCERFKRWCTIAS